MSRFYLVRHGTNDYISSKRIAGWLPNVHLNKEGREQAEAVAEQLGGQSIQRIYSSPLDRAQETASPLARRLQIPIETAEAIGEIRFGDWTGQALDTLAAMDEWKRFNSFRSGTRAPNGEHMLEVQARMANYLQGLHRSYPNERIALFSHGDPIRTAVLYYLGMPLDFFHRIEISPGSITIIEHYDDAARVLCVNQCSKLV